MNAISFFTLYEVSRTVLVAQGLGLLVLVPGTMWLSLGKLDRGDISGFPHKKDRAPSRLTIKSLPKLQPLNCPQCGAAAALRRNGLFCPSCGTQSKLDADYASVATQQSLARRLIWRARVYWTLARIISHRFNKFVAGVMFLAELLVFPTAYLVGEHVFANSHSWFDQMNDATVDFLKLKIGSHATDALMMMVACLCITALFIWLIIFFMIFADTIEMRGKLPKMIVNHRSHEFTNCQDCGGKIEYLWNDFMCLCPYCHVQNFRAQFVQMQRASAESKTRSAKASLAEAVRIIDDFLSQLWIVSVVIGLLFGGIFLSIWFKHWTSGRLSY